MAFKVSLLGLWLILLLGCGTNPAKIVSPGSAPVSTAVNIQPLLAKAELALGQNRLMSPAGNNARYWFERVLALDPKNTQARSGLQLIPLQYLQLARGAAAKGGRARALSLLARGLRLSPGQPQLLEFRRQLELRAAPGAVAGQAHWWIDAAELKARAPALVKQLSSWAKKAKQGDLLAIIYARNDSDGRWIYQQMRRALPGYRLRGDIRTGRPKLSLESF